MSPILGIISIVIISEVVISSHYKHFQIFSEYMKGLRIKDLGFYLMLEELTSIPMAWLSVAITHHE